MKTRGAALALALLGLSLTTPAAAQTLYGRAMGFAGMESRGYAFRPGLGVRTVGQYSIPIVIAVPFTRQLSVDVSTRWAHTRLESQQGDIERLSGLTDTQLRLVYTLGRDAVVASAVANFPTGIDQVDSKGLAVIGAASGDFLPLPVAQYGTGANLTGGVALARRFGGLNVGAGASARISRPYAPFTESAINYRPGVEGRFQLAADGLVGSGRLGGGVTLSTFSADDFEAPGAGAAVQSFQSGNRFVAELTFTGLVAGGTLTTYAWDFLRSAGRLVDTPVPDSRQSILGLGSSWRVATSRSVYLTPLAELKQWTREGRVNGRVGSLQLEVEILARAGVTLKPSARADWGFVSDPVGNRVTVQGWGAGFFGRFEF